MNKIINYFKNVKNIKDFVIVVLLASAIKGTGILIFSNIFTYFTLNGWMGFEYINTQINYCIHTKILIFIITVFIAGFLLDFFILKERFNPTSRTIFWIWLILISISFVVGHYQTISAISPLNEEVFESFKWMVCY